MIMRHYFAIDVNGVADVDIRAAFYVSILRLTSMGMLT
jgi:hypothetical protein